MTDLNAPIATYTERLPQVRRELTLFPDRIEIRAVWRLGKTHDLTVKLSDLTTRSKEFYVRNRWVKRSIVLGSFAVAAAVVFGRPGQGPWAQRASVVAWVAAALCAAVAASTMRKIRFVRLLRSDGKPGLDVAQAGPDAARFEEFLSAVRRHISRT